MKLTWLSRGYLRPQIQKPGNEPGCSTIRRETTGQEIGINSRYPPNGAECRLMIFRPLPIRAQPGSGGQTVIGCQPATAVNITTSLKFSRCARPRRLDRCRQRTCAGAMRSVRDGWRNPGSHAATARRQTAQARHSCPSVSSAPVATMPGDGSRQIRGRRRIRKKSYAKVFRCCVAAETAHPQPSGFAARRNYRSD